MDVKSGMEIDSTRVYRVLLNQLPWAVKPNGKLIKTLVYYLPDCKVLGFGYYEYYKLWYLLVYSPTFPINPWSTSSNLSWHQATGATALTTTKGWIPPAV